MVGIMPTLVALMTAAGVLRALGFLDFFVSGALRQRAGGLPGATGSAGLHKNVFLFGGYRAGAGYF